MNYKEAVAEFYKERDQLYKHLKKRCEMSNKNKWDKNETIENRFFYNGQEQAFMEILSLMKGESFINSEGEIETSKEETK